MNIPLPNTRLVVFENSVLRKNKDPFFLSSISSSKINKNRRFVVAMRLVSSFVFFLVLQYPLLPPPSSSTSRAIFFIQRLFSCSSSLLLLRQLQIVFAQFSISFSKQQLFSKVWKFFSTRQQNTSSPLPPLSPFRCHQRGRTDDKPEKEKKRSKLLVFSNPPFSACEKREVYGDCFCFMKNKYFHRDAWCELFMMIKMIIFSMLALLCFFHFLVETLSLMTTLFLLFWKIQKRN